MDLAHVIKGLLSFECLFRLIACAFTNSLRAAFLLWGWQPKFLIKLVSILKRVIGNNNGQDILFTDVGNLNKTYTSSAFSASDFLASEVPYHFNNTDGKSSEPHDYGGIDPSIESVCIFPSSLAMFSNYGITIFVLLTGIVR